MSEKNLENIRVAAYYIWESEGRPEGRSEEFWVRACSQCCSCAKKSTAQKTSSTQKTTAPKAAAKKKAVVTPASSAVLKKTNAPVVKKVEKPVVKADVAKKTKINPVPVKTASTKIITPLYGSVKK